MTCITRRWRQLVILSITCAYTHAFINVPIPQRSQLKTQRQRPSFISLDPSNSDTPLNNTHDNDKTWEDHFQAYRNFTLETGQANVPLDHSSLGNWVRNQRKYYKQWQLGNSDAEGNGNCNAVLTSERLCRLQDSGFVFDVADHEWMQNYQQLQVYRETHGHTRVSNDVAAVLSRWVRTQRSKYRKGTLRADRMGLLESIAFCWNPYEWAFRENVKLVVEADNSFWDYKVTDGPLGLWMSRQRTQYRKYCCSNDEEGHVLQEYQIELLEMELGMDCSSFTSSVRKQPRAPLDIEWGDRMRQLEEFLDEHGHLNVPRTFTKHKNLGAWVAKVRERYRYHGGHSSERIQQRLEDLFEIGFIWDVCEYKWQNQFSRLIDFYEQHGHAHVPDSLAGIGPWVKEQRREYHKFRQGEPSRLTPKHAMALNRIGLDWNRQNTVRREQDAAFQERLDDYLQYMEQNPGSSTASMPKKLRNWVERQRKLYRKWVQGENDMMEERRSALEDIGVVQDVVLKARK